jgi:hypothetical protein
MGNTGNMKNKKLEPVLRDIELYFQFIFDKGYKIRYVKELPMGDWEVCLESPNNLIIIGNEQGKITLASSPLSVELVRENLFSLEAIVYFLSKGQKFIGKFEGNLFYRGRKAQFNRLSDLLEEYINQIVLYFGSDFENHKSNLVSARNKYFNQYLDKYIPKRN